MAKVWLIGKGSASSYDERRYLCGGAWITDAGGLYQATRFARREDAEHIIGLICNLQPELPFRATLEGFRPSEVRPYAVEVDIEP